MNRIKIGTAVALFMSLALFTYAQRSGQDSGVPNRQEPTKQRDTGPPQHQPEMNPPRGQQETKPKQTPEANPPKTEKQEIPSSRNEQQKPSHQKHGTATPQGTARPTGKSARIPDPQFRANFGRQNTFTVNRILTTTTVVPNQTQFVLAGFAFIFLDPWPAEWLFTDECFIDEVGEEYFLLNVFHPGIRVALFVVE